jgi:Uma2 family endonuclease
MMTTLIAKYSLAEYFEREVQSEIRHEYIDGEIIQMTGGTPNHNTIAANLISCLLIALRQKTYRAFITDQRLWIPDRRIATYPDIMVIAEPIAYQEGRRDTLINPVFIAEVLSPSTANYDREGKFAAYRTIPTFQEYLMISQERLYVEHFQKEGSRWIFSAYEGEAVINLTSIEVAIAITDLYSRVNFEDS